MSVYLTSFKTEFDSGMSLYQVGRYAVDFERAVVVGREPRVKVELEFEGCIDRDEYDAIVKCLRESLNDKYIHKSSL